MGEVRGTIEGWPGDSSRTIVAGHRRCAMRRTPMLLNIVAYAADCRVLGRLELEAERISDLLNDAQTYELSDAVFESLEDGHRLEMPEFTIAAEDVHVVEVVGPRGDPGRRVRTRLHRMQLKVGHYLV